MDWYSVKSIYQTGLNSLNFQQSNSAEKIVEYMIGKNCDDYIFEKNGKRIDVSRKLDELSNQDNRVDNIYSPSLLLKILEEE